MKLNFAILSLATALALASTGCVNTVDGRSQAGVPFIRDSVTGSYICPLAQVVDAARKVLKTNGQLTSDNRVDNTLEAKVNNTTVWIRIEEVDPVKHVTNVTVQTRTRMGGSDVDLAHDIDKKIAVALNMQ